MKSWGDIRKRVTDGQTSNTAKMHILDVNMRDSRFLSVDTFHLYYMQNSNMSDPDFNCAERFKIPTSAKNMAKIANARSNCTEIFVGDVSFQRFQFRY